MKTRLPVGWSLLLVLGACPGVWSLTGCCASAPPVAAAGRPASVPGLEPMPIVEEPEPAPVAAPPPPAAASAESTAPESTPADAVSAAGKDGARSAAGEVPATAEDDFAEVPILEAEGSSPTPVVGCTALLGHAMRRSALTRMLDAGLGAWLRGLDIEPKVDRGRFQGWMIRSIHPGDACWTEVDLREGDVVSRVNRRPIQRPDEAQAIWTALRGSREIVVDYLRDGKARTLRLPVVDDRK